MFYLDIDLRWHPAPFISSSRQKYESNQLIYQKCVVNKVFFPHLDNTLALLRPREVIVNYIKKIRQVIFELSFNFLLH